MRNEMRTLTVLLEMASVVSGSASDDPALGSFLEIEGRKSVATASPGEVQVQAFLLKQVLYDIGVRTDDLEADSASSQVVDLKAENRVDTICSRRSTATVSNFASSCGNRQYSFSSREVGGHSRSVRNRLRVFARTGFEELEPRPATIAGQ